MGLFYHHHHQHHHHHHHHYHHHHHVWWLVEICASKSKNLATAFILWFWWRDVARESGRLSLAGCKPGISPENDFNTCIIADNALNISVVMSSSAMILTLSEKCYLRKFYHYNDVIMSAMASQIASLTIVYSSVYSGADQRKPVNSPHKWPVTRKIFPFDDVIMVI